MDIEKKVRELIEIKNLSIREFCKLIGMTDVNLYRRFKANSLETKHLEKIAEVCEVDISFFFTDSEKNNAVSEIIHQYKLSSKISAYDHNSMRETNAMQDFLLSIDFNDTRDQIRVIDKLQSLAFRFGVLMDNIVQFENFEEKIKKYNPELYKEMYFDKENKYLGTPDSKHKN